MVKKKTYQKPKIKQVKLAPEEAVLTACKLGTGSVRTEACNASPGDCTNVGAGS